MISETVAWWIGRLIWPLAILYLMVSYLPQYGQWPHQNMPRCWILLVGGIILAWLVGNILLPMSTNRTSLCVHPGADIYIIGAAELQHPFEDVQGLSQYEADTWHSDSFLQHFLPFTTEAAKRIYGDETSINLLEGMLYVDEGIMFNLDNFWMKSGVLVGADSLDEAELLAHQFTKRFPPPKAFGVNIVLKAKALPTDVPIYLEHGDFSDILV
jgi:hypothetical protein